MELKSSLLFRTTLPPLSAAVAFVLCWKQVFGLSLDYENYMVFFDELRRYYSFDFSASRFEPAFQIFSYALVVLGLSNKVIYAAMASSAVYLKIRSVSSFAIGAFSVFAFAFFWFRLFPLHEYTQLRASLAISFLFLVFLVREHGPNLTWSLLLSFLAFLFHFSSLFIIPFLFFPRVGLRGAVFVSIAIFVISSLFYSSLIALGLANFAVAASYFSSDFKFNELSYLSPVFIPEYCLILVSLFFWENITTTMRRVVFLEMVGFALSFGMVEFTVIATRGREIFMTLWIFYMLDARRCGLFIRFSVVAFCILEVALAIYSYAFTNFFRAVLQ